MEDLPFSVLGLLVSNLNLKDFLELSSVNSSFRNLFLEPEINYQLAEKLAFPYNLNLEELKKYNSLTIGERLNEASRIGDLGLVERLIRVHSFKESMNEEVKYLEKDYSEAIKIALANNHTDIFDILLPYVIDENDLILIATTAIENSDINTFKKLIPKLTKKLNLLLRIASFEGETEIVKLLLDSGATRVNSALLYASQYGNLETMKILLENGANNYEKAIKQARLDHQEDAIKLLESYRDRR